MSKTTVIKSGNTAFLPKSRATVMFNAVGSSNAGGKITTIAEDIPQSGHVWSPWGDDNLFPQQVFSEVRKNTVASRALNFKIKAHYGKGLVAFKEELDENGKKTVKPQDIDKDFPQIKEFNENNRIHRFILGLITNYEWFNNPFPEFVVSRDFSQIVCARSLDAAFCRWGVANKDGIIDKCYVSAKWHTGETDPKAIHVIDPFMSVEQVREELQRRKIYKFIYPSFMPTPGRSYYHVSTWDSIREGGWLDVTNSIPELKRNMFKNQMTIKYHIKIPFSYWQGKFKDWEKFSQQKQDELISNELDKMDEFLAGTQNARKTFISHYAVDPITGKELPGWEITAIDDKLKDGAYLPDSQAGNSEILFAFGVDPSLIGHGLPGGKLGAGSGSDKREAYLIYISLLGVDRDIVMEPYRFLAAFNKWDPELKFGLEDTQLTTLDKNPTGAEKVIAE